MSLPLIWPVLPHGKLPSTDADNLGPGDYASWPDWAVEDIVDAQVLQRNWAVIFAHANGEINGTDIDTGSAAASETTYIQDLEAGNNQWPTDGVRHSHDGIDSALLAEDIIGQDIMGYRAFGMLRHPAKDYRGLMLFGSIVTEWKNALHPVAIPYDYIRWGQVGGFMYRSAGGASRYLACPVYSNFADLSAAERQALTFPYVKLTVVSLLVKQFEVAMQVSDIAQDVSPGWGISWIVFAET